MSFEVVGQTLFEIRCVACVESAILVAVKDVDAILKLGHSDSSRIMCGSEVECTHFTAM